MNKNAPLRMHTLQKGRRIALQYCPGAEESPENACSERSCGSQNPDVVIGLS